jgi:hypothetical protein
MLCRDGNQSTAGFSPALRVIVKNPQGKNSGRSMWRKGNKSDEDIKPDGFASWVLLFDNYCCPSGYVEDLTMIKAGGPRPPRHLLPRLGAMSA